jgi:ATP-dependent protease ClpP protease subunit
VIRNLFGGFVLACICLSAPAGGAANDKPKISSMRFEWRSEQPTEVCGTTCRTWISAVGPITDTTPHDFEVFVGQKDVHGATLALDSEGGSVVDTIALGHVLRRLDITTTIGTTVVGSAPDGRATMTLSPAADCESMCAFVLLGGAHRYVPPQARVLVHQIWLAKKREHSETASYTAEEIVLVERDIGSLARYTIEMGGGIELLDAALRVPPWQPLYQLSSDEIQRMGLNNVDHLFGAEPKGVAASAVRGAALANAAPGP